MMSISKELFNEHKILGLRYEKEKKKHKFIILFVDLSIHLSEYDTSYHLESWWFDRV